MKAKIATADALTEVTCSCLAFQDMNQFPLSLATQLVLILQL